MKQLFKYYGVFFAWIISIIATITSLYFSEIAHFAPCTLCWYQRICMYPLFLILGVATYREDRNIYIYVSPLTFIGMTLSLFHYLEQKVPLLRAILPCRVDVPCDVDYLNLAGFVTIPLFSFLSFLLMTLFLWMAYPKQKEDAK